MRTVVVALAVCSLLGTGCFVFEEMDSGMEYWEEHSPDANTKKNRKNLELEGDEEPGILERLRQWWHGRASDSGSRHRAEEPSGPPPDPENVLVECTLDGRVQFMRKFDCQLRGGSYTEVDLDQKRPLANR